MLKGTPALALRGQNEIRVLGSAQCAEPSASTYFCPRLYLGFGQGGGRRFPGAQGNLYPKSKNSSDLVHNFSLGSQIQKNKDK